MRIITMKPEATYKNIEKFIRNVNVTYTLVNIIPTLEDRINIEITDLLQYRSIITYK